MTLFERVKETAKSKGFALTELARRAGIGEKSIYTWKPTRQFPDGIEPKRETLEKVADVLGVSVDYLLGNTDDMHANTNNSSAHESAKINIEELTDVDSIKKRVVSGNGTPVSDRDAKLISEYLKALYSKD